MMMKFQVLLTTLLCLSGILFGIEEEKPSVPPIGNFSVPTAMQLAPLVSFGQLLIGQNVLLTELTGGYLHGQDSYTSLIAPNAIYGIRNDLALYVNIPFYPKNRSGSSHSSGLGDILLQGEYAYYNLTTREYVLQGTIVANVQFPTGSSTKDPPTGTGSYSYLLGTTFAYQSFNWYAFISPGVHLTTTHHGTKFGNSYLYQCGFARYIDALSPPGWIFDLMVEFDGTYMEKDKIHGKKDRDSGGNTIFVTPSIWLSCKSFFFQWGIGFPILQQLNGDQDKTGYAIASSLGVAFYF
jgi:Putative MetA-pathway of phenol degradation